MEPPQIVRIKRKRGQDPLQALVLEERIGAKRSKPSSPVSSGARTPVIDDTNFYFKLTGTDTSQVNDAQVLATVLAETSQTDSRNFVIQKPQTEEDTKVADELSDMVNDFMISNAEENITRKKRSGNVKKPVEVEEDEYVYDVYQLAPMTDQNHPKSQIGYIKFFDDEEEEFNGSEPSLDKVVYSDNEDSNAEDYYQNDYPDDEDADIQGDVHNEYEETGLELDTEEINDLYDYVVQNDVKLVDTYQSDEDADYVPFGDDEDEDDESLDDYDEFPRQKFFDNESDDELAMHRDKIFGKLQKMIDEEEED